MTQLKTDTFVYTNSEMGSAECSNQHHIKYDLKLRPRSYSKMKHLNTGAMVHIGVEMLYRAAGSDMSFEEMTSPKMLEKIQSHVRVLARKAVEGFIMDQGDNPAVFRREVAKDIGLIEIMIEGFFNQIFINEKYEIVEPEMQFVVPVRTASGRRSPKFKFAGKVDGVMKNIMGDNLNYLHEVKTTQQWDSSNERFLAIDDQTTGYCWALREMGINVAGIIYTVLKKPGFDWNLTKEAKKARLEARKAKTFYKEDPIDDYETAEHYLERVRADFEANPQKYFIRKMFARSPAQLDAFGKRLPLKIRDVLNLQNAVPFPQPSQFRCRMCGVFDLCANWTDETMKTKYEVRPKKHGELDYHKDFRGI